MRARACFTAIAMAALLIPATQAAATIECTHQGCSDWPGAASLTPGLTTHHHRAARTEPGIERSTLVATINAKLARYVHPTGLCGWGATEQLATFYWQGRRTANGEPFNPRGHTAASRTLPFGTMLGITNPHNGRSVTVRINDRGPFTHAKLDLAAGAAQTLGMRQSSYVCVAGASRTLADAEPGTRSDILPR